MVRHAALKVRHVLRTGFLSLSLLVLPPAIQLAEAQTHTAGQASHGTRQYTVRSGDTLDRIISQQIGASPFSVVFLRDAIAQMNPQALPQGARGTLLAGVVMQIPDGCALRQIAFGEAAACGAIPDTAGAGGRSAPPSAAERMEIERRSWVRYP